jgi:radical SAM protein with 4Fe4S-binding SPASM domain
VGMTGKDIRRAMAYGKAATAFLIHSDRAFGGPVAVALEPTNICKLHCPLCAVGANLLDRERGRMSLAAFQRIVGGLPDSVMDLYLWGQGEPFLAHDFLDMVRFAAQRGLSTVTSTNGHHLGDSEGIVTSGLDRLIISLDGIDQASYTHYRRGGDFNRVTAGIRGVVAAKKRRNSPLIIELQYLITAHSLENIGKFKLLAADLGADTVVFKTIQAASLDGGDELLPSDLKYTRYRRTRDGALVPDKRLMFRNRCMRIYYSAQVDWQGNIVPCCFDKDSQHIFGNLFHQPFMDIWNGPDFRAFRASIRKHGRVYSICSDCTEGLKRLHVNA